MVETLTATVGLLSPRSSVLGQPVGTATGTLLVFPIYPRSRHHLTSYPITNTRREYPARRTLAERRKALSITAEGLAIGVVRASLTPAASPWAWIPMAGFLLMPAALVGMILHTKTLARR